MTPFAPPPWEAPLSEASFSLFNALVSPGSIVQFTLKPFVPCIAPPAFATVSVLVVYGGVYRDVPSPWHCDAEATPAPMLAFVHFCPGAHGGAGRSMKREDSVAPSLLRCTWEGKRRGGIDC